MMETETKVGPTAGAINAAIAVGPDHWNDLRTCAEIIDRWTGALEMLAALESLLADAENFDLHIGAKRAKMIRDAIGKARGE